jgi:hypothetical protein
VVGDLLRPAEAGVVEELAVVGVLPVEASATTVSRLSKMRGSDALM